MPELVAPLAGAWIETAANTRVSSMPRTSLPSRERGSKPAPVVETDGVDIVAPLAGAWIETVDADVRGHEAAVAPLAGAWPTLR
jgi:hypothetical protein